MRRPAGRPPPRFGRRPAPPHQVPPHRAGVTPGRTGVRRGAAGPAPVHVAGAVCFASARLPTRRDFPWARWPRVQWPGEQPHGCDHDPGAGGDDPPDQAEFGGGALRAPELRDRPRRIRRRVVAVFVVFGGWVVGIVCESPDHVAAVQEQVVAVGGAVTASFEDHLWAEVPLTAFTLQDFGSGRGVAPRSRRGAVRRGCGPRAGRRRPRSRPRRAGRWRWPRRTAAGRRRPRGRVRASSPPPAAIRRGPWRGRGCRPPR